MVEIIYKYGNPEHELHISGHANYEEEGKDIVCAAVSTLAQTLAIAIEEKTTIKNEIFIDKGFITLKTYDRSQTIDNYFRMTLLGLRSISEEYPNYVSIQIE